MIFWSCSATAFFNFAISAFKASKSGEAVVGAGAGVLNFSDNFLSFSRFFISGVGGH